MSGKKKHIALKTLRQRARPALESKHSTALVGIARRAKSPNEALQIAREKAYELAFLETGNIKQAHKQAQHLARAVQSLVQIKRDYTRVKMEEEILSVVSDSPRSDKQDPGKSMTGGNTMSTDLSQEQPKSEIVTPIQQPAKKPQLPLQSIDYRAVVNGAFASVRAVQTYKNDATIPVEAVYCFPLPDEATVTGCKMQIGNKSIVAELKEKVQARKEYDQAVQSGHHGALMEEQRPNIFTMNMGGLEPGETITVEIDYVQPIPWQGGGGRFRIPLVVAPRFIPGNPTGKNSGGWAEDTDQVPDASLITPQVAREGVSYHATINISFAPGFRCQLSCPSHPMLIIDQTVAKDQVLQLQTGEIKTDRDFTLSYRSIAKRAEIAAFYCQTEQESFCLANIIPPAQTQQADKDILFVLDRSGSMSGAAIVGLKNLTWKMLVKLRDEHPGHQVGVILFDHEAELLCPLGEISEDLLTQINRIDARGGTELGPALDFAHKQFAKNSREKVIVVVTDGQTESRINYQTSGARIVTAGISSAINDSLLKEIARKTGGSSHSFYPGEDFDRAANTLLAAVSGPVVTEIKISASGEIVGLQDSYTDRPASISVRFKGKLPEEFTVTGKSADGQDLSWQIKPQTGKECDFLPQIWARDLIRETPDSAKQLAVSLQYKIICRQTSFVAVSFKEVPGQKPARVEIPVELPHGWDYDKVFGQVYGRSRSVSGKGIGVRRLVASSLVASPVRAMRAMGFSDSGLCGEDDFGDDVCYLSADFEDDCAGGIDDCYDVDEIGEVMECCDDEEEFDDLPEPATAAAPEPADELTIRLAITQPMEFIKALNVDADFSICCLVAALIMADNGELVTAEKYLGMAPLNKTAVAAWTPLQQAKAAYFIIRLSYYGLKVKLDVRTLLSGIPAQGDPAMGWYLLAQKEQGRICSGQTRPLFSGAEAAYLRWKFGLESRPNSQPWNLVP